MSDFKDVNETMFLEDLYTRSRDSYQQMIDDIEQNIARTKKIIERDTENLTIMITKRDILNAEIEKLKGRETNGNI